MVDQAFLQELSMKTQQAEEIVYRGLERYLEGVAAPYIQTILESVKYSLTAGGKRLRPLMMQECFALLVDERNPEYEIRLRALEGFMTALEMIHTYSLVHDDLPAMDNDKYRRGRETTWVVYGEGMGVLAGDALLNSAFEIAFDQIRMATELGASQELIHTLSDCGMVLCTKAGIGGMLGGQVADVESEEKHLPMTMDRILFIHKKKTAALIEGAMMIGGLLAGADREQVRALEAVACNVGIAFQIQDDILDVEGDSRELGKPVGSDALNGKETYVTLQGPERSKEEVARLSQEAIILLNKLSENGSFLENLIMYLVYRRK